jgi:hypothetical protein
MDNFWKTQKLNGMREYCKKCLIMLEEHYGSQNNKINSNTTSQNTNIVKLTICQCFHINV